MKRRSGFTDCNFNTVRQNHINNCISIYYKVQSIPSILSNKSEKKVAAQGDVAKVCGYLPCKNLIIPIDMLRFTVLCLF